MTNVLNESIEVKSNHQWIITLLLGLIALIVPTFLSQLLVLLFGAESFMASHSQLIVGSIVNTALVICALNIKGFKSIIGIVTMPSISTILSGYIFKSASIYMIYMIPAIWIGNFALIYCYKLFFLKKNYNYFLSGLIGIIIKVSVIFGSFGILNLFNLFPNKVMLVLKSAMSITQLITASIGVVLAYLVYSLTYNFKNNK